MKIVVLATGGTIASVRGADGMWVPTASADSLLAGLPQVASLDVDVQVESLDQVNGWNITPSRMVEVGLRAQRLLATGAADGIVVTHGTDTIEETMLMCQLIAGSATANGPVVFGCAMRAGSEVGADGPRNLLNALRLAASPDACDRGVLLTVNDQIHHALWATKLHTTNVETFESVEGGPVGFMDGDAARFVLKSPSTPSGSGIAANVPLVKAFSGMDGDIVDWYLDGGAEALVIEGTGAGNVPGAIEPGIVRAVGSGIPVVIASRCPYGRPYSGYGGPGGGARLDEIGVLHAAHLNGPKARIATLVGLHETGSVEEFDDWLAGFA